MPNPSVPQRLARIRERIHIAAERVGRDPARVRLLAVAKTATPEALLAAWQAGQREFAHNRVQALEEHARLLPREARWHLIGPLQGKKVARALAHATLLHTLARARVATRLQQRLAELGVSSFPVLLQVNPLGDGRHGLPPEELAAFLDLLAGLPRLQPRGLMTLAAQGARERELRTHFANLRRCLDLPGVRGRLGTAPELSMGMSHDFEIAVEEGATLVRIGRALFPVLERPEPPAAP